MLLKVNDLIINTDQLIKAEFKRGLPNSTLTLHMVDGGFRPAASTTTLDNMIFLKGVDADLVWSALCQIATPATPVARV
ncbi:MAG TPA: hypothetical protein VHQ95_14855 [Pyrinomonadaceae bacterium]|nr:hypothetical protein [Pyrinomonadaceae bacterium]